MNILHKVAAAGYNVRTFRTKQGKHVFRITDTTGGYWLNQVFCPNDGRSVTILKLRKLISRCSRLLAEAGK